MAKHWSIKQFQKTLEQLPAQMVKNMSGHLDEIANNTTVAVAMKAPTSGDGSHNLRDSVRYHDGKHPLSKVIRAGGDLTKMDTSSHLGGWARFKRGFAGQLDYDYALAVEFGTQFQPAQPFFFPTIRARRDGDIAKMRKKIVGDLEHWGFR